MSKPDRLWFTENDDANRLLAEDPFALLVGFALDQQITVQQAFQGPLRIKQRLGTLDPKRLAALDLEPAFREKPAVHRFPGTMAARVHDLAAHVADEYDGDASRVWRDAKDGADLKTRLGALPGFGDMKVRSMTAVLAKRFGVGVAREVAPDHPTLGDVDSAQSLLDYQAAKREHKAKLRSKSVR
ncbi:MAG: DNA repair protein [Acidobacteriota bacterium]|nr:DNA repair protein [Acidobacteriota bacterium]